MGFKTNWRKTKPDFVLTFQGSKDVVKLLLIIYLKVKYVVVYISIKMWEAKIVFKSPKL